MSDRDGARMLGGGLGPETGNVVLAGERLGGLTVEQSIRTS